MNANGYRAYGWLALALIVTLCLGIIIAYLCQNFFAVPFAVVIMGIISFFGVLWITKSDPDETAVMRKAITVSILVVYLGLLPALTFQGILQFQVTENTTMEVTVLNQTIVQAVPQAISLVETVVTSFTALVAAVLLFYFGSRSLDNYYDYLKKGKSPGDENSGAGAASPESAAVSSVDPTKTEKVTTIERYDKDEKLIDKTVTTETYKNVEERTVVTESVIKKD